MNQQPGQNILQNLNQKGNEEKNKLKERNEPIEIPNLIDNMPLVVTGLPKLEPFKGIEIVAATTCLIAVQSSDTSNNKGESASKFVVYDMYSKPVLYAHEETGMIGKNCKRNVRDFDIHLCDGKRMPILSSKRTGGGYCAWGPDTMEMWHKNSSVGMAFRSVFDKYLYLKIAGCNTGFAIPTGAGGPFNTCSKPKNNGPFSVVAQGGAKVAEIVRLDASLLELQGNVECIMVHFPADMPPLLKLFMLQVSFLIDYTNFDDQPSGGRKNGGIQKLT